MYLLLGHICLYLLDIVPVKVICDQWDEFTLKNDLDLHEGLDVPAHPGLAQRALARSQGEGSRFQGKQAYVDYSVGGLGLGAGRASTEKGHWSIPTPPLPFPETWELEIYPFCRGQSGSTHGTTDNSGNSYIAPGEQSRIVPMASWTRATEGGAL